MLPSAPQALFLSCHRVVGHQCNDATTVPEGLGTEVKRIVKKMKHSDLIDRTLVLPITTCKFEAKHTHTPDAFKHVPDQF